MINISEIINTDCYIDCGSNERLREVVKVLEGKGVTIGHFQETFGINDNDKFIALREFNYWTFGTDTSLYPTHHINDIQF
jgi:hypothetical protein